MFGLTDPAILKALSEKIHEQIPATIYYDASGSINVRKALAGADAHPILQSGFMHQKILVLDDETVFLGSANFTTQSLRMHDNLTVGLASRKVARFLKEKTPHSSGYLRTLVGGQDVEIWLLPDPKGHALADLRKKIRNANRSLCVALFTLTHSGLAEELIRAYKRGVEVAVVIDLHSALGASAAAVETLRASGVRVLYSQGIQLLHHKFVYIDGQTLVCGSANWTKAAFQKNSDCLLTLHNLNSEQRTYMNRLWRRLETTAKPARSCFRP
jgi:phosphatidylserine/phosphatidylglycerophosphate/cardiolipin synthase-like enzyme